MTEVVRCGISLRCLTAVGADLCDRQVRTTQQTQIAEIQRLRRLELEVTFSTKRATAGAETRLCRSDSGRGSGCASCSSRPKKVPLDSAVVMVEAHPRPSVSRRGQAASTSALSGRPRSGSGVQAAQRGAAGYPPAAEARRGGRDGKVSERAHAESAEPVIERRRCRIQEVAKERERVQSARKAAQEKAFQCVPPYRWSPR
jgi:hypothetical protein